MSEDLRAELEEKEEELILAAQAGNNLLKDNQRLEEQLKGLEKVLEVQKNESEKLKVLIVELETERDGYHDALEQARADALSAKEEFQRSNQLLFEENAQLKDSLTQVTERHEIELGWQQRRLVESENQLGNVLLDQTLTRESLQQLRKEKQALGQNLSSVSRSFKKLSLEVQDRSNFWESQFYDQQELNISQGKELTECKGLVHQLQMELEQANRSNELMVSQESLSSGMSLHDELSEVEEVEQSDPSVGFALQGSSGSDSDISGDEKFNTLRPTKTVSEYTSAQNTGDDHRANVSTEATRQGSMCQSCLKLEAQHKTLEAEAKAANSLLLVVIKEKLKLQQQIEAWQSDMALVLESRMKYKLAEEKRFFTRQQQKRKGHKDTNCCCFKIMALYDSYFPGLDMT